MLYVIGDSFANGDEIADHLVPNWEGYRTKENPYASQEKNIQYFKEYSEILRNDSELSLKFMKFQNENRWPTVLGKLLGKEVINRALSGKSIHNMSTMLVQDIAEMIRNNKKPELIIVQMTSLTRFQVPSILEKHKDIGWSNGHVDYIQINPGHINRKKYVDNSKSDDYFEKMKLYTYLFIEDINFFYGYLNELLTMQTIAKLVTGKDLVIVRSIFDFSREIEFVENNKQYKSLQNVYDLLDFKTKYYMFPSMSDIVDQNPTTCFNTRSWHVCHNTHKLFAENIAKILIDKQII